MLALIVTNENSDLNETIHYPDRHTGDVTAFTLAIAARIHAQLTAGCDCLQITITRDEIHY